MNQSQSGENRDPLSMLSGNAARIVQRTERSLTPWVQRALRRATSSASLGESRPTRAMGAVAQRSMALFERVQRTANRSNVWNQRAETISAPAHATDNFAGSVLQRFPETASKYERQSTGGPDRGSTLAAAAVAPSPSVEPMEPMEVPGSEALGSDIASETFHDIRERIQRAQRGEGSPARPVQGLGSGQPESSRERYSDAPRPPSFPPSFGTMPSEPVSRMQQPERMRIRRFTQIEEVTGGAAGRPSSSGLEPGTETSLPETANRNIDAGTEIPYRAPRETGTERHVQRAPSERADQASIQRKPSAEPGFRPLPKPAVTSPAEPTVQREHTEPRTPAPDVPVMPAAGIADQATEAVQRVVDDSMPLVSARREAPATPVESAPSDSSASSLPVASLPSIARIQRKESGSTPTPAGPAQATRGTNAPMPVARPPLSRTPARIQRAGEDELDEGSEDETEEDAANTVEQLQSASDESTDSEGGADETGSEESETEGSEDDSDFPLRRSVIQRSPSDSLRPDIADAGPVVAPGKPRVQRTIDVAADAKMPSLPPVSRETAPADTSGPSAPSIQRAPVDQGDTSVPRSPVSSAPGRPEKPTAPPPTRVEPRASAPSQPSVQRSVDPAPTPAPAASSRRSDAVNGPPSPAASNLSRDDSPTVHRAVEPAKTAEARPEFPTLSSTEVPAEPSVHPTTGATVSSIQRQIGQAMPLRSTPLVAATESAPSVDSAFAGEIPSIQREADETKADSAEAPKVIRSIADDSSTSSATATSPQVSSDATGPLSVRRQLDQPMPLRSQEREVSRESAGSESPERNDSPSNTEPIIQRTVDDTESSVGIASRPSAAVSKSSRAEFRKVPSPTSSVQRTPVDVSASEGGRAASEASAPLPQAGTPAVHTEREEPRAVQRSVTNEMPIRARPRPARQPVDGGSGSPAPSQAAMPAVDDVIRRQAVPPDVSETSGSMSTGPVSSPPLARRSTVRPGIQRSADTNIVPPVQIGSTVSLPPASAVPGPLAPRASAVPLAIPAIQRKAESYQTLNSPDFFSFTPGDVGGERYTSPSPPDLNAPVIQRMPASDNGGQGARDSLAAAMPLVHPFGRTVPQSQPRVQRDISEAVPTAPEASYRAESKPLPWAAVQSAAADSMTLRRMPSIAPSAVIQRAPQTVTYISPQASGDGTIQRADAKPGTVITPPTKKKEEKKDEKKDETKAEPPDLDTLAKQILPLLKRMLVVERERHVRR